MVAPKVWESSLPKTDRHWASYFEWVSRKRLSAPDEHAFQRPGLRSFAQVGSQEGASELRVYKVQITICY